MVTKCVSTIITLYFLLLLFTSHMYSNIINYITLLHHYILLSNFDWSANYMHIVHWYLKLLTLTVLRQIHDQLINYNHMGCLLWSLILVKVGHCKVQDNTWDGKKERNVHVAANWTKSFICCRDKCVPTQMSSVWYYFINYIL